MIATIKQAWPKIWPNALVVVLIACIPFGMFMAWFMGDPWWLLFCAPLIIFWS